MKRFQTPKLLLGLRHNFWFRPLTMLVLGIAVGLACTELDHWLSATGRTLGFAPGTSPGGARSLLSVAAGALATTLAIALSMTMVTIQLASSQYTPRLLRRFLADRFTQYVLGAFLGTIAFTFLVLRAVRSPEEGRMFVPVVALTVAVVLTLACFAFLVVFLHRTMRAMQASTIVADIGTHTASAVRVLDEAAWRPVLPPPSTPSCVVLSSSPGYVQLVDDGEICRLVAAAGAPVVRLDAGPGTFVLPNAPLLTIFGLEVVDDDLATCMRACFTFGRERTQEADPAFGVRQLVDMALKALSPGINDVTTAVLVVNQLGVIAQSFLERGPAGPAWRARVRPHSPIYIERTLDLETFFQLAFDEIVLAANTQPRVHVRILELLSDLARDCVRSDIHDAIARQENRTRDALGHEQAYDRGVPTSERDRLLALAPTVTWRGNHHS